MTDDIMRALQTHRVRTFQITADLSRLGAERCQFQWWCETKPGDPERWGFGHCATAAEAVDLILAQATAQTVNEGAPS